MVLTPRILCAAFCSLDDGGNLLYLTAGGRSSSALAYTACGAQRSAGVGSAMYSTCFSQGFFTLTVTAPTATITGFRITGNLGADNQGNVVGGSLGRSTAGNLYGFYKV